jgi:hypothetical protein
MNRNSRVSLVSGVVLLVAARVAEIWLNQSSRPLHGAAKGAT